ncbi:hypothetical protein AB6A40_011530 [Gnathostoma spinigerum]|uniref:Uncharacterized protein n=1 Tax=Gnathostoma spinigerum TaxID=75299 RepID=A0ABD6F341_9BILA
MNLKQLSFLLLVYFQQTNVAQFQKEYGYSFYLAGLAVGVLLFAMLAGVLVTTIAFFPKINNEQNAIPENENESLWRDITMYPPRRAEGTEKWVKTETSADSYIPVFQQQTYIHPPRPGSCASDFPTPQTSPTAFQQETRSFLSY